MKKRLLINTAGRHVNFLRPLAMLFSFSICLALLAETVDDIPNPRVLSGSFVSDSAHILGPEYSQLIDGICQGLQEKNGAELAVITVTDLGGITIEDFAEQLFHRFGIGQKGKDNGVLLLFSLKDRRIRIEVGYGLESTLTDADSSRILDENGLPFFKNGLYGRGLYASTRSIAEKVSGTALSAGEPSVWPVQPQPPEQLAKHKPETREPLLAAELLASGILGFTLIAMIVYWLRLRAKRGKRAREKAISAGWGWIILGWFLGLVAFIVVLGISGRFLVPFAAWIGSFAASLLLRLTSIRRLRHGLVDYHLSCTSCGKPMNMVSEEKDNGLLSVEESAEEQAGGMDYEIWLCPNCSAQETIATKMGKAEVCPQCRRRTLKSSCITLERATTAHGGKEKVTRTCANPKCGYSKTFERNTTRISSTTSGSSSSSSSSSHSSSSSSFGGGSSGGGGASKSW